MTAEAQLASFEAVPPQVTEIARVCRLISVFTLKGSMEVKEQLRLGDTVENLQIALRIGGGKAPDVPQSIACLVGIKLSCFAKDDPGRLIAEMVCETGLRYEIKDAGLFERLTAERIHGFAAVNGLFNAWPYAREFFQSCSVRMGIGPVTLPTIEQDILHRAQEAARINMEALGKRQPSDEGKAARQA